MSMDQRTLELLRALQSGSHDAQGWAQIQNLLPEQRRLLAVAEDRANLADISELLELWGAAAAPELGGTALREAAAIAEEELEQGERAVQLYAQSLERAPSDLEALHSLERLLRGRRDHARLETVLAEHAQRLGATPEVDPSTLASVYLRLGALRMDRADEQAPADLAPAIEAYEQALDLDADPSTLRALADLYARRGGPEDAKQAADLYCTLGDVLGAGEGVALLERALDQAPDHDGALDLLEGYVPESDQGTVLRERWASYVESSTNEAGIDKRRLLLARAYAANHSHRDALVWLAPLAERGEAEALELQAQLLPKLRDSEMPPPADAGPEGSEPRPATLVGFRLPPHELAAVASSVKAAAGKASGGKTVEQRRAGGTLVGFQLPPEQAAKLAAQPAAAPAAEAPTAVSATPSPSKAPAATAGTAAALAPKTAPRSEPREEPRSETRPKPKTNGKSGPAALAASLRSSRPPAANAAARPSARPEPTAAPTGPAAFAASLRASRAPQPAVAPRTSHPPSGSPPQALAEDASEALALREASGSEGATPVTPVEVAAAGSSTPPPLRASASLPAAAAVVPSALPAFDLEQPSASKGLRGSRWLVGGVAALVVVGIGVALVRGSSRKEPASAGLGPSRVERVAPPAAAPTPPAPAVAPTPRPAAAPRAAAPAAAAKTEDPARLQPGQLRVRGGKLSSQQVTLGLEDSLQAMERCYDKALARAPKLAGKVTYSFTVDKAGRPTKLKSESASVKDRKLETCSLDAIKKARFPKPKKKPAQVTWPVTYKKI